jgi:hypothetical protein
MSSCEPTWSDQSFHLWPVLLCTNMICPLCYLWPVICTVCPLV